jgi:hypothetical protein
MRYGVPELPHGTKVASHTVVEADREQRSARLCGQKCQRGDRDQAAVCLTVDAVLPQPHSQLVPCMVKP